MSRFILSRCIQPLIREAAQVKRRTVQLRRRTGWQAVLVLVLLSGLTGCTGRPAQTTRLTAGEPGVSIVAALPAAQQDTSLRPKLVWLPRDETLALWWSGAVSGGWIGAGQHYAASQGMAARLDYYSQDGRLNWSYKGPASASASDCYQCAALRPDGIVIAGGRHADGASPEVGQLAAFGGSGQIIWETRIVLPGSENLGLTITQCLVDTNSRILAVASTSRYNVAGGGQPVVVTCTDESGKQVWQRQLDFPGLIYSNTAVLTADGGLYLAVSGYIRADGQQSREQNWLMRLDRDGQELWRRELLDGTYQYQVRSLDLDSKGSLYLSCTAAYIGTDPTPTPPADPAEFHDRYRSMAWQPAALLKLDSTGAITAKYYLNGQFGAAGGQVFCADGAVYWLSTLTDDIVPPYIFMSMDHRSVVHVVLAVLDAGSKILRIHQFGSGESGDQLVQRLENGQPVLIGIMPFIAPAEWATETFIPGQTG